MLPSFHSFSSVQNSCWNQRLNAHYVFDKEIILFILKHYRAKTQIRKIDWEKRTPLPTAVVNSELWTFDLNQHSHHHLQPIYIPVLNKSGIGDWNDKTLSYILIWLFKLMSIFRNVFPKSMSSNLLRVRAVIFQEVTSCTTKGLNTKTRRNSPQYTKTRRNSPQYTKTKQSSSSPIQIRF